MLAAKAVPLHNDRHNRIKKIKLAKFLNPIFGYLNLPVHLLIPEFCRLFSSEDFYQKPNLKINMKFVQFTVQSQLKNLIFLFKAIRIF
ncbi:predicted protein [Methanosarcina acetivorans C2A]|uniref:Uncharacterized protein n=1 Tax=Methanosarcina acetivorans (strain ATCC 35395 / DSM 2834 / JCM 12185 / C2A) TaxID=188937 RepID=Q8TNL1_METAC|nr:predicted protein [Methanosarcina acetivorans C2A]